MKKKIAVLLTMGCSMSWAMAGEPEFFKQQGVKVISSEKAPGGLKAWKVEKNGVKTVFYTTADEKVLISGVLWDAKTGANLSDAFLTPDVVAEAPPQGKSAPGAIPEPIKGVDKLVGIKEGKGDMERTLYIIFDPLCPHCHAVYAKTRQFVAQGGTIKWIPSVVLGRQRSLPVVAAILQDANPTKALATAMRQDGQMAAKTQPNTKTLQAVQENESYFWEAFDRNPGAGQTGVPVAFFLSKNGSPQMVAELDNDALLQRVFNDLKK